MLSDFQQKTVWDGWLSAEIRAAYFAELSGRYQRAQKYLVAGSLVLSSGATLALVSSAIPASYAWVKPVLTLMAAILSAWSLVAKNERGSIDCADLHFRWNTLAMDYEALWADVHSDDAAGQLAQLRRREAELSKSSTAMPDKVGLMLKCQENIVMHHQHQLTA